MAQPHKGDRAAFTLRLPTGVVDRIKRVVSRGGRQDWIVDAIERKLAQEGIDHARQAEAEPQAG